MINIFSFCSTKIIGRFQGNTAGSTSSTSKDFPDWRGSDKITEFDDIFNDPSQSKLMRPHLIDHKLGLLEFNCSGHENKGTVVVIFSFYFLIESQWVTK